MDIADSIAIINGGRIEQIGSPRALYDHPANEFVMSFIGQVNRVGDGFIRPHDVEIQLQPGLGTRPATVERVVYLGFEVRVELRCDDGEAIHAQLTRDEANRLDLSPGQTVAVSLQRSRVFDRAPEVMVG